jgi:glycosyltransferase involved in cell wall biosynthesis
VLGLARGAVPEVVEDGVTGFVCGSVDELIAAVPRIPEIERAACRLRVERNFSETSVVEAYLAIYCEMLLKVVAR